MLKQITHTEAQQLMEEREIIVADVRDRESFEQERMTNAIHLSMSALQDFTETADKTHPILVYCYHGISSQSVAQHLVEQGFMEVYSLQGGFSAWKANHPTTKEK